MSTAAAPPNLRPWQCVVIEEVGVRAGSARVVPYREASTLSNPGQLDLGLAGQYNSCRPLYLEAKRLR